MFSHPLSFGLFLARFVIPLTPPSAEGADSFTIPFASRNLIAVLKRFALLVSVLSLAWVFLQIGYGLILR